MNKNKPLKLSNSEDLLFFPGYDMNSKFVDVSGSTLENLLIEISKKEIQNDQKVIVLRQQKLPSFKHKLFSSNYKFVKQVVYVRELYNLHQKKYGKPFQLLTHGEEYSNNLQKTG